MNEPTHCQRSKKLNRKHMMIKSFHGRQKDGGFVSQIAKRKGIIIEVVPETAEGDISIPALERLIKKGDRLPALIAISHIPTNGGESWP